MIANRFSGTRTAEMIFRGWPGILHSCNDSLWLHRCRQRKADLFEIHVDALPTYTMVSIKSSGTAAPMSPLE
jgi:hypothetical protein